jgi:hypothetical protein
LVEEAVLPIGMRGFFISYAMKQDGYGWQDPAILYR